MGDLSCAVGFGHKKGRLEGCPADQYSFEKRLPAAHELEIISPTNPMVNRGAFAVVKVVYKVVGEVVWRLNKSQHGTGRNILDMKRAVDFLQSRAEVQSRKIGCYGHSMGSTHTWLVGPWEPRIKCLVGNCCLPTYAAMHREHMLHCFPNFVPGIFPEHDTPDIAALTAPRALHLNLGELDGGSPIDEARRGVDVIAKAYSEAGASANFSYYIEDGAGHVLSDEMWARTKKVFSRHLL